MVSWNNQLDCFTKLAHATTYSGFYPKFEFVMSGLWANCEKRFGGRFDWGSGSKTEEENGANQDEDPEEVNLPVRIFVHDAADQRPEYLR